MQLQRALSAEPEALAAAVQVVVVVVSGGPVDTSQPAGVMGSGGVVTRSVRLS
jgi:hypothetical protein